MKLFLKKNHGTNIEKTEENHRKINGVDIVDSAKKHGTLRTEISTIIGYCIFCFMEMGEGRPLKMAN